MNELKNTANLETFKELTKEMHMAAKAYYSSNKEIMSNKEWDEKYDKLAALEEEAWNRTPGKARLIQSVLR